MEKGLKARVSGVADTTQHGILYNLRWRDRSERVRHHVFVRMCPCTCVGSILTWQIGPVCKTWGPDLAADGEPHSTPDRTPQQLTCDQGRANPSGKGAIATSLKTSDEFPGPRDIDVGGRTCRDATMQLGWTRVGCCETCIALRDCKDQVTLQTADSWKGSDVDVLTLLEHAIQNALSRLMIPLKADCSLHVATGFRPERLPRIA